MARNRFGQDYPSLTTSQMKNLSNGPGKLTRALGIDLRLNGQDLLEADSPLVLMDDGFRDFKIVRTKRVGIDYAEEAIHYPYRFYIEGNPYVSKL